MRYLAVAVALVLLMQTTVRADTTFTEEGDLIIVGSQPEGGAGGGFLIPRGGGKDGGDWLIAAGPPFYLYFMGNVSVNITNPLNGSASARATHKLNATIGDAHAVCYYQIGDNAWNNYSCAGGVCSQQVTFPRGANMKITVRCVRDDWVGYDSILFTVYGPGAGGIIEDEFALVMLTLIFYAVWRWRK